MRDQNNNNNNRKKILIFSAMFIATAMLAGILIYAVWNKNEEPVNSPSKSLNSSNKEIFAITGANLSILDKHVKTLHELDKEFAASLNTTNDKDQLNLFNERILAEENLFNTSIDSIAKSTAKLKNNDPNKIMINILSGYKLMLTSRNEHEILTNQPLTEDNNLSSGRSVPDQLQVTIAEKNNRISVLENELKNITLNNKQYNPGRNLSPAQLSKTNTDHDNTQLKNQLLDLTGTASRQKMEIEKLTKQNNELIKNNNLSEADMKTKMAHLQKTVEESAAELRLARVDCNLSRVDAGKIIYTSRQRKELLSEASGILNSLSQSENYTIRKKVEDKITSLNKVAANTRD